MIKNELIINYIPSDIDKNNIDIIKNFLIETDIPYIESKEIYGMFTIKDIKGNDIELRYVSSEHYPMDNSKRFGESHKGIPHDYFLNISKKNIEENNIRTIWIFDFELKQFNEIIDDDGQIISNWPRMKNVIFNTIKTATGHIDHRIYARDCEVREVSSQEERKFLVKNCFYGYRSANTTLGLYLKKDKNGLKKGELLMLVSFGNCFYGNKNKKENPDIELIRQSSKIGVQVVGGASKLLTHFLKEYPTLTFSGNKKVNVNKIIFFVDASHNDGRAMTALGYDFVSWEGAGFKNVFLKPVDEIYYREDGRNIHLMGNVGDVQERKPLAHKRIMELIESKHIVSVANAGTQVYSLDREEYLQRLNENKQ